MLMLFCSHTQVHRTNGIGWQDDERQWKANEEQNGNDKDSHDAENNSNYDCW